MAEGENRQVYSDAESSGEEDEIVFMNQNNNMGDGPGGHAPRRGMFRKSVKIENYTGGSKQSWTTWRLMFERIARMNGWQNELADQLFAHLRGSALEVACGLPDEDILNYDRLIAALEAQFGHVKQSEIYLAELRNLTKSANDSHRDLGHSVKMLCKRAYPTMPYEERERLARIHFIDALPESELRMLVLQGKPANIDEAVHLAEELDGYRKLERQRTNSRKGVVRNVTTGDQHVSESLDDKVDHLARVVDDMVKLNSRQSARNRPRPGPNTTCWTCSGRGHFARDCPGKSQGQGNERIPMPRDMHRR